MMEKTSSQPTVSNRSITIRDLLKKSSLQLEEKGIESPRLTAELLLASILGMERVELFLDFDRGIRNEDLKNFQRIIERRISGEPTSYILGEAGFMGLDLKVRKGVFIPRPETEVLCEVVLREIHKLSSQDLTLFEIGCGCGAISLAIASQLINNYQSPITSYCFYASDISDLALEVARENAKRLGLSDKIQLLKGDLFEPFIPLKKKADLILSNPPYIPSSEISHLPFDIRGFEPREAMDGGEDGLTFLKKIIEESPLFLKEGGVLALEVGEGQANPVKEFILERNGFLDVETFKDLSGIRRGIIAKMQLQ